MAKPRRIKTAFITILLLLVIINFASPGRKRIIQPENNAPTVTIIKPKNDSTFAFNAPSVYTIAVVDKEDGDSRYDEINGKEVLLQVKYAANYDGTAKPVYKGAIIDAPGLVLIRTNNCFNCHAFNSKGIGPSFYDIVQKYAATEANINLLAKRVKDGATGTWGKVAMPMHPELNPGQAQAIVDWILHYAAEPGIDYYVGTSGTFRLKPRHDNTANTAYILTASYIDHGIKTDSTKPHLEGCSTIVVKGK